MFLSLQLYDEKTKLEFDFDFEKKKKFRSRNRNNTTVSLLIFFKLCKEKNKLPQSTNIPKNNTKVEKLFFINEEQTYKKKMFIYKNNIQTRTNIQKKFLVQILLNKIKTYKIFTI
jgi:hypothetical protein